MHYSGLRVYHQNHATYRSCAPFHEQEPKREMCRFIKEMTVRLFQVFRDKKIKTLNRFTQAIATGVFLCSLNEVL